MSYSSSPTGIHTVIRLRVPISNIERQFTGVQHSARQATVVLTPAILLTFG